MSAKTPSRFVSPSRRAFLKQAMAAGVVCSTDAFSRNSSFSREESASCGTGQGILSLDELCGDWKRMSELGNPPAIENFWGALQATDNLLAVTCLTLPPYSQSNHSGYLHIDGEPVHADESRWYAYQILRRSRKADLEVETSVRMVFEGQGVLSRIVIRNLDYAPRQLEVGAELLGAIGRYDSGWDFIVPQPGWYDKFTAGPAAHGEAFLIRHASSPARVAFAFSRKPDQLEAIDDRGSANWRMTVGPGETRTIEMVMAVGDNDDTLTLARQWASGFEATFAAAKSGWEKRYAQAFIPRNGFYSGNLPILTTTDERLRRVYYMGILSRLQMLRTNLPIQPRVIVTAAPQWAVTLTYFWDNTLFLMSMLDPEMMKVQLKRWLTMDISRCYAQDCISGAPRGPWYAANNLSVFGMLQGHLRVTGDYGMLDEKAGEKTVLEHLKELATGWKRLVPKDQELADYGDPTHLLECDPVYIHAVASLNAANVGMMRMLAELLEMRGDSRGGEELRADAKSLAAAVLKLYVPGEGVWNCALPDGRLIKARHVYDFATIAKWMAEDLSPSMRREMVAFVERELITEGWMRAMSLQDAAAPESDRPDHGPMGAYDEWPALTLQGFCKLGYGEKAFDPFYRFEKVTHEGPYAQSHEILGRNWDDPVRVALRGYEATHTMIGSTFTELIVGSFLGFQPDWRGERILTEPCLPPGFEGGLSGILFRGKQYELTAGAGRTALKQV